jgi:adenylate kinase
LRGSAAKAIGSKEWMVANTHVTVDVRRSVLLLLFDDLLSNLRVLRIVLVDAIVVFRMTRTTEHIDERLIVRDDDQLEVHLITSATTNIQRARNGQ